MTHPTISRRTVLSALGASLLPAAGHAADAPHAWRSSYAPYNGPLQAPLESGPLKVQGRWPADPQLIEGAPGLPLTSVLMLLASIGWGLVAGEGQFATGVHPSLAFMLRAWIWPPTFDLMLMIATGIAASAGMICLTQAYRLGQPAVVAPFEYAGMVWALIAGYVMWRQVPDGISMIGITIIIGAGLYIASLELRERRAAGS